VNKKVALVKDGFLLCNRKIFPTRRESMKRMIVLGDFVFFQFFLDDLQFVLLFRAEGYARGQS